MQNVEPQSLHFNLNFISYCWNNHLHLILSRIHFIFTSIKYFPRRRFRTGKVQSTRSKSCPHQFKATCICLAALREKGWILLRNASEKRAFVSCKREKADCRQGRRPRFRAAEWWTHPVSAGSFSTRCTSCTCQQDIGFLEKRRCSTYIDPEVCENKERGPSRGCRRKSKVRADPKTHAVHRNQTTSKCNTRFFIFFIWHTSVICFISPASGGITRSSAFPLCCDPVWATGANKVKTKKSLFRLQTGSLRFKRRGFCKVVCMNPPDAAPPLSHRPSLLRGETRQRVSESERASNLSLRRCLEVLATWFNQVWQREECAELFTLNWRTSPNCRASV